MAEQIPYGVATSLINKLASLAFVEIGRIHGVSDKLEDLKKTLESIHIVLSDAEQRQSEDPVIKHWISRFKQVLHDADDLLDGLAIKDLRCKVAGGSKGASKVRSFFSSENPLIFRAKLAHKIEKIQKSFNDIAEDMSKLKLNPSLIVLGQNENDWRETSSFVLQSDIIGREKDKNDIVDLLMQKCANQNVSLLAIVGIGGLGKTTLAQLVYNDTNVQKHFPKKMWVCVSEDFEAKLLLKKMLKSLKDDDIPDLELDQLGKMLQKELNGHMYILVLDDVWNENELEWSKLRTYLMCGGEGSKILVTTRHMKVSQIMGINDPYVLNGLTKEQSWTFLKKVTFGDDTSRISQSRESIGERIAEKCCGVPLAIKTMGGFLRDTNLEWLDVLNDDIWRLCKERGSIMPVLNLSYQNLSLELRQCFAYCSLYPKDWEIPKDELIQLWMAQGYLASSIRKQSLEDVGNQYVKTLLMRSFFQDVSMDEYGEITGFKLHDLMHDLAMLAAGSDCYLVPEGKGIIGRPMHVAFHDFKTICPLDMLDASRLRTLVFQYATAELMINRSLIQKLKYLRVLDLSYSSIARLPGSIDKIKHLRYLDLSCCEELISLPKSIGNLVCLQTLKLRGCSKLVFYTEVIRKLINLRHLDIGGRKSFNEVEVHGYSGVRFSNWLSTLTNIVKIELSSFHSCQHVPPLERLPCLKTVWIQDMEELQCIHCDEISDVFFPSLETLILNCCKNLRGWQRLGDDNKPDDAWNHLSLPPFPRLSILEIRSCPNLTCMPPFPHLVKGLKLSSSSVKPLIETCSVQLEPSSLSPLHALRYLVIGEVTDVEAMAEDWMQNLTSLESLSFCESSSIIQHMFGHLHYLPAQLQRLHFGYIRDDKLCLWEYEENNNLQLQAPFKCLRSLQEITFASCKMKALPEHIFDLQSVTHISITHCTELESLQVAKFCLPNLQSLQIIDCPRLYCTWRDESGEEWPKIAHISDIKFGDIDSPKAGGSHRLNIDD